MKIMGLVLAVFLAVSAPELVASSWSKWTKISAYIFVMWLCALMLWWTGFPFFQTLWVHGILAVSVLTMIWGLTRPKPST